MASRPARQAALGLGQLLCVVPAEVFPMLGRGWRRGSDPITVADVEQELYRLEPQLAALDLLATNWRAWTAGPSARSLLRAAGRRPGP